MTEEDTQYIIKLLEIIAVGAGSVSVVKKAYRESYGIEQPPSELLEELFRLNLGTINAI